MAINLITQPASAAPTDNDDYTNQNLLINGAIIRPNINLMTDWTSTAAAPAVAQGAYISHGNNMYVVESSDEAITGTPSAGLNFLKLSVSGTTLTAAWVTTFSGYTYNPASNGWYSGTDQIIFNGDYLDGTAHRRFLSTANMPYQYLLADGRTLINRGLISIGGVIDSDGDNIVLSGGMLDTEGGDIDTSDGDIDAGTGSVTAASASLDVTACQSIIATGTVGTPAATGQYIAVTEDNIIIGSAGLSTAFISRNGTRAVNIDTNGGTIQSGAGTIDSEGGTIQSGAGTIDSEGGAIQSGAGDIDSEGGTIRSGNGTIDSEGGPIRSNGGAITASAGAIYTTTGSINSVSGTIYSTNGNVYSTNGNVTAYGGSLGCDVLSSAPSGGNDGDIVLYDSGGGIRRLYCKIGGTWRSVNLA